LSKNGSSWWASFLDELCNKIAWQDCTGLDAKTVARLRIIADTLRTMDFLDFQEIGDHLYDGVYIADGQGKTLYVNKAYERITGLRASEVVGKYVQDLEAKGVFRNAVTPEVIRRGRQVNSIGASGRNNAAMLISGNPIFDSDGKIKLVAVIEREMTDLLKMQNELDATQEKILAIEAGHVRKRQEIEHLRKQVMSENLIGESTGMSRVLELVRRVADFDVTVLIQGETGTGKEVVANEIHLSGSRSSQPFIKVNCAAIPASLLEAELFGYEKGAFTGAVPGGKMGLFELADKGTLLLDEVGDMPLELQSKLLRVLQDKEITRVGGLKRIKLDVRIVAATNRDLKSMVAEGRFREDLFYRLSVFPIAIPALRERQRDLALLTRHFLALYNGKYGKAVRIEAEGLETMARYSWPGNVRELQNIVERLVLVSDMDAVIGRAQLVVLLNLDGAGGDPHRLDHGLKTLVDDLERRTIEIALSRCGSTRKAALLLKLSQSAVVKKAKRLGIRISDDARNQPDEKDHRAAG